MNLLNELHPHQDPSKWTPSDDCYANEIEQIRSNINQEFIRYLHFGNKMK